MTHTSLTAWVDPMLVIAIASGDSTTMSTIQNDLQEGNGSDWNEVLSRIRTRLPHITDEKELRAYTDAERRLTALADRMRCR